MNLYLRSLLTRITLNGRNRYPNRRILLHDHLVSFESFNFDIFRTDSGCQQQWRMESKGFIENLIQIWNFHNFFVRQTIFGVEFLVDFRPQLFLDSFVSSKLV